MKKRNIIKLIILLIVLFAGLILLRTFVPGFTCWPFCGEKTDQPAATTTLANPASVHCEEVGGTLDIRTDASGGQVGYCIFPDKTECEEWALLRNECSGGATLSGPIIRNDGSNFRNLSVKEGETITSPLKVTGEVSDGWFFEGSFPVTLVDWDGRIIADAPAQAKGDWMTTGFVPFEVELKFVKPANPTNQDYAKRGAIIFKKDNPSDRRDLDAAYELPVRF